MSGAQRLSAIGMTLQNAPIFAGAIVILAACIAYAIFRIAA